MVPLAATAAGAKAFQEPVPHLEGYGHNPGVANLSILHRNVALRLHLPVEPHAAVDHMGGARSNDESPLAS